MTYEKTPGKRLRDARFERGDRTRDKLLTASIDVFGRYGFDGTSTRTLADKAGVNLQAIPYYFGGKERLYVAAAEHIASLIAARVASARDHVHARLKEAEARGKPVSVDEARSLLSMLVRALALIFVSRESESWARFLIREQMEPTEAFQRVYRSVMRPLLEIFGKLIGALLGEDPVSEHVRLRTLTLIGSVMVFRIAHATVAAQLGWKTVGPRQVEVVSALSTELVASIGPQNGRP